jgi:hypothetical protein
MSTQLLQLYTQNHWLVDGVDTIWNFTFADGYISRDYVKAFYSDELGNRTSIPVSADMFIGPFQLEITPAVPAGYTLVVYRDTPKDAPLVNFSDGATVKESNLDLIARQAVHIAAEVMDGSFGGLTDEYGFKALKQVPYTGPSVVNLADNGRSHFKTDGAAVVVPNALPTTFLTTVTNHSASTMNVVFDSAVAYMQGGDGTPSATWALSARSFLQLNKVAPGVWYISGQATKN